MNLKLVDWLSDDYDGLFEKEVPSQLLQNPLLQKDIWRTIEDLGLETHEHERILSINFSKIQPLWFNLLAKLFIITKANKKDSIKHIRGNLGHLRKFSYFLREKQISNIRHIDTDLFEQFNYSLLSSGFHYNYIAKHYSTLVSFFDTCRMEGWLDVDTYWFKGRRKTLKSDNDEIDYLPEGIWNQLEENLRYLPEPFQRKVLIIRSIGLRVGELLNLPFDCLRKRNKQWRLRLKETEKFRIEDELPIPLDLVAVIKEQQEYIQFHFDNKYKKLFCSSSKGSKGFKFIPVPKVMYGNTFNKWLNKFAAEYNIRSKNGEIWHFTSHQFRRTVGTIMANAGVRDLIIQKYLRHCNRDMQNHYKHLLKQVIGDEYQKLATEKNFFNIEGKLVATHKPKDVIEEYIRLRLHQTTTQQGECHRSNLKNPCPTVNGCWRCGDWMTSEEDLPYLKQDLTRLQDELEKLEKLGMDRAAKEVRKDINHLQIRINAMEKIIDNV